MPNSSGRVMPPKSAGKNKERQIWHGLAYKIHPRWTKDERRKDEGCFLMPTPIYGGLTGKIGLNVPHQLKSRRGFYFNPPLQIHKRLRWILHVKMPIKIKRISIKPRFSYLYRIPNFPSTKIFIKIIFWDTRMFFGLFP